MFRRTIVGAAFIIFASTFAFALNQKPASLKDLAFLEGKWITENGGMTVEEIWSSPAGGMMVGVGKTMRGDKAVFFEFLRIEQRPGGEIVYIAAPRGQGTTEFKLTGGDGKKFIFENPQHDFPQKITYEKIDADTVRASIAGPRNGKETVESWEYRRAK
jgi:hypothetical protein